MSELDNFPMTKFQVFTNPDKPDSCSNFFRTPQLSCVKNRTAQKVQVVDVTYHQVVNSKGRDFQQYIMMTVDLHDFHGLFPNIGFIEVERLERGLALTFEVNFQFSTWQHPLNLLSYVEKLRERMLSDYGIHSTQQNLFEEDLLHLRFSVDSGLDDVFDYICHRFSDSLELAHNYILSSYNMNQLVIREIEIFHPYTQPANLIVNYLMTVLKCRMPNADIRQTIVAGMHQSFLRLSYPVSLASVIESILLDYAELVACNLDVDCFFSSLSEKKAYLSRIQIAKEEMSLLVSASGQPVSDAIVDSEMSGLTSHLSNAIIRSIKGVSDNEIADEVLIEDSTPELSA